MSEQRNKTLGGYLYQPEYRRWVDAFHRVFDFPLQPGISIEDNFRQLRKLLLVEGFEVGANHAKECVRVVERSYSDRQVGIASVANTALGAAHILMENLQPIDLVAEYLDMGDRGESK